MTARQTVKYHYILTVQLGHNQISTRSGVVDANGGTREEALAFALSQFPGEARDGMAVLFFSFEPNQP